ncbi:activator of 90 kDa heat shock protein ATPase homolog 1 [Teleopsis dalmanni]|uniref:activator of 90 kDa heat shock protein ATPase homolog 1 n=1 Tax=Teleopsis dalmanni TaxID=139649 RepID=UPI000D32B067|nr:activator of 90 kDa heat shock protein ATPase homolog 1 [Teleopsis dalmanni]
MAKWGEGDPRWIVEERPDATNVNNWHWTEKNATQWSKDRILELFTNFKIEQNNTECVIDVVDKIAGEATANNRKGKLIFFYEWELVLKWTGQLQNSSKSHKGKITIPNLSEENDLNEIEITISIDESNNESETLKTFMYNVGRESIRAQLGLYIKELKEQYSKNLILPKKGDENLRQQQIVNETIRNSNIKENFNKTSQNQSTHNNTDKVLGCKLDVQTLTMTIEFYCNAADLYNTLTKQDLVSAFTRAPAKVDAIRGGEFILYGGNVQGKFEELVPEKIIKQSWRLKSWPLGHYSNVEINLEEAKSCTQLLLKQTGIPASEFDTMKTNWQRYYWNSIKQTFGFGAALLDSL